MRFVHELVTPRVVFHAGSLARAGAEVQRLGASRVLVLAGPHSAEPLRLLQKDLGAVVVDVLDEVVEHVPVEVARAAVQRADRARADLLLSVGGGSSTGLAKAVAKERGLPILAIPTTYAGSGMTSIWGLTEGTRKTTGRDERVRPRTVLYDPELTVSLPAPLTAASGRNAIAHCVEVAYAADASPVVRIAAVEAVRALAEGLPACVDAPADVDARALALYGAWLAGMTLGNASMGIHHKLCHVLGGAYQLPHAALHAAVIPYATAYNCGSRPQVMADLARALRTTDAAGGLWDLAERIGAPHGLAELRFGADGIEDVVQQVMASPPANPRSVDAAGLRCLLEAAVHGRRPGRDQPQPARAEVS